MTQKNAQPIRKQFFKLLALMLVGFLVISWSSAFFIFWPVLERQDTNAAHANAQRVVNNFNRSVDALRDLNFNFTSWDDSYRFVSNNHPDYIDINFPLFTFTFSNLSDILFLDENKNVLWQGHVSSKNAAIGPMPIKVIAQAQALMPVDGKGKSGFLDVDGELFIYAISGITDSRNEAPVKGALMMTKKIDKRYLLAAENQLKLRFNLEAAGSIIASAVPAEAINSVTAKLSVRKQDNLNLVSYQLPLLGGGIRVVTVSTPRIFAEEARRLFLWNSVSVLLSAIVLLWFAGSMLHKRMIEPLGGISARVEDWEQSWEKSLNLQRGQSLEINRISEAIEAMHDRIIHIASTDQLTGLANRRLLEERVNGAMARAKRHHVNFALLYIDLDKFKPINDNYGHQVGDQVLIAVANRLQSILRANDSIARIGGDEFIALIEIEDDGEEEAKQACCRILESIEQPMPLDGNTFFISASIGIALYPDNSDSTKELMVKADKAMYKAKNSGNGKPRYHFWEDELDNFAAET